MSFVAQVTPADGARMCPQPVDLILQDFGDALRRKLRRKKPRVRWIVDGLLPEFSVRAYCKLCLGSGSTARAVRAPGTRRRGADARDDGSGGDDPYPNRGCGRLRRSRRLAMKPPEPEIDAACEHLCKLLGMLGSAHPGERAAGLKADQFVKKLGLTWPDIVCTSPSLAPPDPGPDHFDFGFDDIDWEAALGLVLARRHELRERDRRFVESLNEWCGEPTPKQLKWLRDIYERLGGRR